MGYEGVAVDPVFADFESSVEKDYISLVFNGLGFGIVDRMQGWSRVKMEG